MSQNRRVLDKMPLASTNDNPQKLDNDAQSSFRKREINAGRLLYCCFNP
jgi:hypothetical protein